MVMMICSPVRHDYNNDDDDENDDDDDDDDDNIDDKDGDDDGNGNVDLFTSETGRALLLPSSLLTT